MPIDRRHILRLAAAGAFGAAGLSGVIARALAQGNAPQGIVTGSGEVRVNGRIAPRGTVVQAGDRVKAARSGSATVVVGEDAFLVRGGAEVAFGGSKSRLTEIRVESGGVLSVFGRKALDIKVSNATVGIRGTGAYVECHHERTYFCLCYGEAVVTGSGIEPRAVKTRQHEEPLWLGQRDGKLAIEPAPFLNHTDDELILLEGLVGRRAPFTKPYPG